MTIYGVGLLAGCYLIGQWLGEALGELLHIDANVGGVGFAMLLLIVVSDVLQRKNLWHPPLEQGLRFWNAMYIPVIVAMSAVQNVRVAFSGGYVALLVGIVPAATLLFLVPILSKLKTKE